MLPRILLMQFRKYSANKRNTILSAWHNAFTKHLLFTNIWTSGVLMIIGDVVEQEIEFRRKKLNKRYDWERVGRMFVTGLACGPIHHYFYGWLDKKLPHRTIDNVVKKILVDQFVMSPFCIAFLFYSVCLMESKTLGTCTAELKGKFLTVYMVDWTVWPPTQFINFYFVPTRYQVLYINAVTMVYNVFLSYIKHDKEMLKDDKKT